MPNYEGVFVQKEMFKSVVGYGRGRAAFFADIAYVLSSVELVVGDSNASSALALEFIECIMMPFYEFPLQMAQKLHKF